MFFDEQGLLNLDDLAINNPAYKAIMEDGVVTENELKLQVDKVVGMMHEAEERFSDADQFFIKNLLGETSVLSAIYNFYELQNLKDNVNV